MAEKERIHNLKELLMHCSQGGTCQNFDRDARPIFFGLKSGQILFFWVGKIFSYFSGFCKISAIFWESDKFPATFLGLQIFVSHT